MESSEPQASDQQRACPACGFDGDALQASATEECPKCGVVLAKARARRSGLYDPTAVARIVSATGAPAHGATATSASATGALRAWSAGAKAAFRHGAVLGLVVYLIPWTRFVFSYLSTLIHELGHSATSWLFGYPAIPTLDFLYGGGVSFRWPRSAALSFLILAGLAYMIWWSRYPRHRLVVALSVAVVYGALAVTPIHDLLIIAMGHGAELLAASVFYYRALSGRSTRHALERSLYAACAVFLNVSAFVFAYRLVASALFQRQYEQAKGGGHWMDFSRLSDSLGVSLTLVAGVFWLGALAPFVAAWLCHLNRAWWVSKLERF